MANETLNQAKAALKTLLGTVTGIRDVIEGRTNETDGFPFVRMYLSSFNQPAMLDNAVTYDREYAFTVEIIQEDQAKDKLDNEVIMQNTVDDLLDKIGANVNLSNNCMIVDVESGTIGTDKEYGATLAASCIIRIRILKQFNQ